MSALVFASVDDLSRRTFVRRSILYITSSRVWTPQSDGVAVFRCAGAAGGGALWRQQNYAPSKGCTGGSAGTVGLRRVRVQAGQSFTLTLGAGGRGMATEGVGTPATHWGGLTTITGPGLDIRIPGASCGVVGTTGAQNEACADPTGLDWFILGARNTVVTGRRTGGAAAALLVGGQSWPAIANINPAGAGVGSSNDDADPGAPGGPGLTLYGDQLNSFEARNKLRNGDASHSLLLVDVSGGNRLAINENGWSSEFSGDGVGGGFSQPTNRSFGRAYSCDGGMGAGGGLGGHGGKGGGGGGAGGTDSSGQGANTAGDGGAAFITIEFLEENP